MEPTWALRIPSASVSACRAFGVALCAFLALAPPLLGQNPNPVPFVHQPLVPTAVAPGGPDFTLTVNGAGFVPDSVIQWNGSARPTTFVSNTQLTAAIPAADIATIGSASVTVVSSVPGGGVSNAALLLITFPIPTVTFNRTDFGTSGGAVAVATADFNSDGKGDVAVLLSNEVQIFLGNGDGTFQSQRSFQTGGYSDSAIRAGMIAADLNQDGDVDLALTNHISNEDSAQGFFSVFQGNGDGTFQPPVAYSIPDFRPTAIASADLNGDGILDLTVIGLYDVGGGAVRIFLGTSDGTFLPGNASIAVSGSPYSAAMGDFDGDGVLDLAVRGSADLSILLGNGDGTFRPVASSGGAGFSLSAADFNRDAKLDLAGDGYFDTSVSHSLVRILGGAGDGTFQLIASYELTIFSALFDLLSVDLNADGQIDLIVKGGNGFFVLLGKGDGTFLIPATHHPSDLTPVAFAAADFDSDGRMDLAAGNFSSPALSIFMQASPVDLEPGGLHFGDRLIGTPVSSATATLTNNLTGPLIISSIAVTGGNAADFNQTNDCPIAPSTLAAGESCTVTVTFLHENLGDKVAAVTINDDAPGYPQQVLNLTGTIVNPTVALSATSLDFGQHPLSVTSAARTVMLSNSGEGALTILGITASGDFARTNNCGSRVDQGAQCTINITFYPTDIGTRFGVLTIANNSATDPKIVSLTGVGVPPAITLSATTLTFGTQDVGTTSVGQEINLTNNGPGPLTVTSVSATGDFAATNNCVGTVEPSASCTISVTFTPTANGSRNGTLTIQSNAAGNPQAVSLAGKGLAPVADLSPATLEFPNQSLGTTSSAQKVTLTNSGGATMDVHGILATTPFEETNNCPAALSAGASCSIDVSFTPTAIGTTFGAIVVTHSAAGSPHTVEVRGNGMNLQLAMPPGASDSATVTAGSAATFTLVLDPKGFVGTVSLACTWNGQQPRGASCAVSPAGVALNGADPASLTVNILTTARSLAAPRFGAHRAPLDSARDKPLQPGPWARHAVPLLVALLILMLTMTSRRVAPSFRAAFAGLPIASGRVPPGAAWGPLAVTLLMVILWAACGGGGMAPPPPQQLGTPAGNYTLTITVTAGEVTQTTVLGLKVN